MKRCVTDDIIPVKISQPHKYRKFNVGSGSDSDVSISDTENYIHDDIPCSPIPDNEYNNIEGAAPIPSIEPSSLPIEHESSIPSETENSSQDDTGENISVASVMGDYIDLSKSMINKDLQPPAPLLDDVEIEKPTKKKNRKKNPAM